MFDLSSPKIRVKINNPLKMYNQLPISLNEIKSTSNTDYINKTWGNFNHLLSEEINTNSVNLYRSRLSLIPIDCRILNIRCNRYVIYKYPERIVL